MENKIGQTSKRPRVVFKPVLASGNLPHRYGIQHKQGSTLTFSVRGIEPLMCKM